MKLSGFATDDVEVEHEESVYSGFLKLCRYKLKHKLFKGGWSNALSREAIVRAPSVGVLLYDPVLEKVVLVEQFRVGPWLGDDDPWLLEIVAGISEPGETLEAVALREVEEEAGCIVKTLLPVTNFYLSPGATNEKLMLYCGIVDSTQAGGIHGLDTEDEDIKVHVMDCTEAWQMVEDGRIANAPAIVALQWLQIHKGELAQYV